MKRWLLIVSAFAVATAHAQLSGFFGARGAPDDFYASRVSVPDDPAFGQTVRDFVADVSERLGECAQEWYADDLYLVIECLATEEGTGDVLLQFLLDYFPRQGVARLSVYNGFDGTQFRSAAQVLNRLPLTSAELDVQADVLLSLTRLRDRYRNEVAPVVARNGGECVNYTPARDVHNRIRGGIYGVFGFTIPDRTLTWEGEGTKGGLAIIENFEAEVSLALAEWQLVQDTCNYPDTSLAC